MALHIFYPCAPEPDSPLLPQALFGNLPQNALLNRLLAESRKQEKKRGNLSECFWKYCV